MSIISAKGKALFAKSRSNKAKIGLFTLLVLLLVSVSAVFAQEDDPVTPQPDVEFEVLSETQLPYGVESVVRIYTNKDSFLSSLNPNTNYGFASTMTLGYVSGVYNAARMLMEFNLSPVPSQSIINNATLNIYQQSSVPSNDSNMGFKAQYMKSQWNEGSVTWNNANYLGGTEIGIGEATNSLGWKTTDVTVMVSAWHSGQQPNYGLIVTGDEGPQNNRSRVYRTKEYTNYRPYIDVNYTSCSDQAPPNAYVKPLPTYSPSQFKVSWTGTDSGSGIRWYDVQYRINGGGWTNWKTQTTSTSATYSGAANGQTIDFRARALDNCGNQQSYPSSPQAWTNIDTVPPSATVNPLPQFTLTSQFIVTWSGTDNASGIANYDVQLRINGGSWTDWKTGTTNTSAQVTGAQELSTYEFRARATDKVGNVQSWTGPQAQTIVFTYPIAVVLPFSPPTTDQSTFTVSWVGFSAPGTTITTYNVYYRYNQGVWNLWQDQTASTSADFSVPSGNGLYEFSATARNSLGQQEPFTGEPEAAMLYNDAGNFLYQYFPMVVQP